MSKSTGSKNTKGIILEILHTNNVVITHALLNWSLIGSNFFHVGTKMNQNCSNLKKIKQSQTNTRYMLNIWYTHKLH